MDGPGDYNTKWSKSDRERQIPHDTNELIYKQKQTHRFRELMVTRWEGWWEGIDWEFGTDMYTLLYLK